MDEGELRRRRILMFAKTTRPSIGRKGYALMSSDNVIPLTSPAPLEATHSALEEVVRAGVARILQAALVAEADAFVARFTKELDEQGRRQGSQRLPARARARDGHRPDPREEAARP